MPDRDALTYLAIIDRAVALFDDDTSWLAEDLRWDRQYLIELIETITGTALGTVIPGAQRAATIDHIENDL